MFLTNIHVWSECIHILLIFRLQIIYNYVAGFCVVYGAEGEVQW